MIKMKKTFVGMLAVLFLLNLVVLANAESFSVTGDTTKTAIHGTTISGTITINNTDNTINFTQVKLISQNSSLTFSYSPDPFSLNYGETKQINYNIVIPQYASPGNYDYDFLINATNGTENVSETKTITVTVNQTKSLEILSTGLSVYDGKNETTISVKNKGNVNLNSVELTITNSSDYGFNVLTSPQNINAGSTVNYLVKITKLSSSTKLGSVQHSVLAKASDGTNATASLTLETSYCRAGEQGNSIKISEVDDRSSGDDWVWAPLKKVNIRVEVENNADVRRSITVKLGLYDVDKKKFVSLSTDEKELEQTIRIDKNDDEYYNFEFTLPADLRDGGNYRLYVKAFEKGKESESCTSYSTDLSNYYYQNIEIDYEEDVIIDEVEFPTFFTCGSLQSVSFKVYNLNLGDEEKMRVNVYSFELGLNVYSEQFELDEGESETISLNFLVPEGKEAKTYRIKVSVEHDYRESLDVYKDSTEVGVFSVRVEGDKCVLPLTSQPRISAKLSENTETKVGKDLSLEITLTNSLNTTQNFILSLDGYETWASSLSLNESSFTLNAGETKTIKATFRPTKAGTHEFTIKAVYGARTAEQKVSVTIEESIDWLSKLKRNLKENATFYLTIGIFVVLILIILVIVLKYAVKKD